MSLPLSPPKLARRLGSLGPSVQPSDRLQTSESTLVSSASPTAAGTGLFSNSNNGPTPQSRKIRSQGLSLAHQEILNNPHVANLIDEGMLSEKEALSLSPKQIANCRIKVLWSFVKVGQISKQRALQANLQEVAFINEIVKPIGLENCLDYSDSRSLDFMKSLLARLQYEHNQTIISINHAKEILSQASNKLDEVLSKPLLINYQIEQGILRDQELGVALRELESLPAQQVKLQLKVDNTLSQLTELEKEKAIRKKTEDDFKRILRMCLCFYEGRLTLEEILNLTEPQIERLNALPEPAWELVRESRLTLQTVWDFSPVQMERLKNLPAPAWECVREDRLTLQTVWRFTPSQMERLKILPLPAWALVQDGRLDLRMVWDFTPEQMERLKNLPAPAWECIREDRLTWMMVWGFSPEQMERLKNLPLPAWALVQDGRLDLRMVWGFSPDQMERLKNLPAPAWECVRKGRLALDAVWSLNPAQMNRLKQLTGPEWSRFQQNPLSLEKFLNLSSQQINNLSLLTASEEGYIQEGKLTLPKLLGLTSEQRKNLEQLSESAWDCVRPGRLTLEKVLSLTADQREKLGDISASAWECRRQQNLSIEALLDLTADERMKLEQLSAPAWSYFHRNKLPLKDFLALDLKQTVLPEPRRESVEQKFATESTPLLSVALAPIPSPRRDLAPTRPPSRDLDLTPLPSNDVESRSLSGSPTAEENQVPDQGSYKPLEPNSEQSVNRTRVLRLRGRSSFLKSLDLNWLRALDNWQLTWLELPVLRFLFMAWLMIRAPRASST